MRFRFGSRTMALYHSLVCLVLLLLHQSAWSQQPGTVTVSGDVAATTALTVDERHVRWLQAIDVRIVRD